MEALESAPGVLGGETPVNAGSRRVPLGNADVEDPCQVALVAVAQAQAGLSEWPDVCEYRHNRCALPFHHHHHPVLNRFPPFYTILRF